MAENRDEAGRFIVGHTQAGPGRDSLYDPAMNDVARKLALLGLTDEEMASFFGVSAKTLYNWQAEYPAFFQSVQDGKTIADANVADSLYKRATGEHVEIEKIHVNKQTGEATTLKIKQYIPGEAGAAMNWLKNRRKQDWRDKVDHEHSGQVGISVITRKIVDAGTGNTDS